MKIYLDNDFRCYVVETEHTVQSIETDFFDGKCDAFIEGYRFVPEGQEWTRADGVVFSGEMVSPWKPYEELERAQIAYEKEQYEAAIDELLLLI
jgi:hypothetical protein